MRPRDKTPVLAKGERPACGFRWFYGDGDCDCDDRPYLHTHGCACGRAHLEHERFRAIWQTMAADEVGTDTMRKQIDRAMSERVQVRQRMPLRTGRLPELNGHRRALVDGVVIDLDEDESGDS